MDALYQEELLEHWRHSPYRGVLAAPDRVAEGMNPLCGDEVRIELQLAGNRVVAMRFGGQGCVISQAAASLLAALVEHHTLAEARALDRRQLLDAVGVPLSPARLKCALLPWVVFRQALGTPDADPAPP